MSICKSCGRETSLSQRDILSGWCLTCVEAKSRGISPDELRAQRQDILRGWLEATFRYYSATKEWPLPQVNAFGRFEIPNDWFSRVVLTIGQILSAIACVSTVLTTFWLLALIGPTQALLPREIGAGVLSLQIIIAGAASFAFWLAMFFVFGRAKWVVRLVECQQAMMARLLGRIGGEEPPIPPPPPAPSPSAPPLPAESAGEVSPTVTDEPAGSVPPPVPVAPPPGAPPPDELVLAVVDVRGTVGWCVVVECDVGGQWVPPMRGGEVVEVRRPDGSALTAIVEGEERHVRVRRPGRVAFLLRAASLALGLSFADVAGATAVRIDFRKRS